MISKQMTVRDLNFQELLNYASKLGLALLEAELRLGLSNLCFIESESPYKGLQSPIRDLTWPDSNFLAHVVKCIILMVE